MRRPCEDPLAEYTRGITPYSYCYNNPVRYIDPLGMAGEDSEQKDIYGRNRFDFSPICILLRWVD